MPRKSTRRDFLRGRSAADAAADLGDRLLGPEDSAGPSVQPTGKSYLIHVTRRAMACEFEIDLNAGQYPQGTAAALDALGLVSELEGQMSVFRPESEISRLNRTAADGPVPVEPRLFDLLELAWRLSGETAGAFDVTAGPLWRAWGFARRQGAVPSPEELADALEHTGAGLVDLDAESRTVHFHTPGLEINLAGIGKGYALDRAAERLVEAGVGDCLLHGGQSSVLARGRRMEPSADAEETGWKVGLRDPVRPNSRLAEILLVDQALATSGSARQYFRHAGRRYGHILDPRSGWPAEGVYSATVVAPTAALADALATAFCVMGADATLAYCQNRPELSAVLVCPGPQGSGVQLHTVGFEDGRIELLV
jgi:thiamine biosynthesis lipoprotein